MLQILDANQYVGHAEWLALGLLVWKAGRKVGRIEAKLHELATNHLGHLEADIQGLRDDIRALMVPAVPTRRKK